MRRGTFLLVAVLAAIALLGWFTAKKSGRLRAISAPRAQTETPAFLPVQSKNAKDLAAGKLLVASRNLGDPNFVETVVLLVHYDDDGAVGLVLNRRSRIPVSRVFDGLDAAKDRSDPVYLGGPVEKSSAFALLQSRAKVEGAKNIFDSVNLISSKSLFEQTMSAQPDPGAFHVYLGYAGWTSEQLRQEVDLGAWFIFPADAQSVFNSDPDSLWSQMIRKTELKRASLTEKREAWGIWPICDFRFVISKSRDPRDALNSRLLTPDLFPHSRYETFASF